MAGVSGLKIALREVALPDFGMPEERPEIPVALYEERCRRAYGAAGADWLVVYGDREHYANLVFLCGFDPRFEEAALLLGPGGRRALLVGNEGLDYAGLLALPLDVALCQSFSLLGQDRSIAPRLTDVLREAGIGGGQRVGVVGWKYLEAEEAVGGGASFFAPAMLIDALRTVAGGREATVDATRVLMHPTEGLRARNEVEQIAAFEWAAARATAAVGRIVRGIAPGMTEMEAAARMGFGGETMSTHLLFASGRDAIVGLRSPGGRQIAKGDGISTAVGFWGGLCARAGLVDDDAPEFIARVAVPYFRGVVTWYQTVGVGVAGGVIHERVTATLAEGGLRPALNPGHLTSFDEWVHSPVRPGSAERLASGMAFQCDIIPTPVPAGQAVNCEDPVVFADEALRAELRERYPAVWERIAARQAFMRRELGIASGDDVLPLSTMPAYLPPLWLTPGRVLVVG